MKSKHRTRIALPTAAYSQLAAGPFAALVAAVTLSANATPGSLQFDTNASRFSLGALGGNSLTFVNTGNFSVLSTLTGTGKTFTVNAPIVLTPAPPQTLMMSPTL